jgi:methyltransferase family protein
VSSTSRHRAAWGRASLRQRVRWAATLVAPYGVVYWRHLRRHDKQRRSADAQVEAGARDLGTRYEQAIQFLLTRGLDEYQVREASMPERSLDFTASLVSDRLPRGRPLLVLHVGNFVGVSLAYFTWLVRERDAGSVVVSIDPNGAHRGLADPQSHALALLHHFGLLASNIIVPGYTLEQNPAAPPSELACEHVLASLGRVSGRRYDLVVLDGNHREDYLSREFAAVQDLLADDSIIVFDDVEEGVWDGVVEVFARALRDGSFVELGQDGRVGVLQLQR